MRGLFDKAARIAGRQHGLLAPRTNIDHRGDKVDCHWPQIGLTVELLSYRFHGSRAAFEADVARRRRSHTSRSARATSSSAAGRRSPS